MGRTINVTDVLLLVEALELLEGFRRPSWLEMPGKNVLDIQNFNWPPCTSDATLDYN